MSRTDKSKATLFTCWCEFCRETMKIGVNNQRTPQPDTCPFCGTQRLQVETIKNRARRT